MTRLLGILTSIFLFVSPAAAMEWWSFGTTDVLPGLGATIYGLPMGGDNTTARARSECTVPIKDVILEVCVVLSAAPGAAGGSVQSRTATIMIGSTPTDVSVQITETGTAGCDQGEQVYVAQTDEMSIEFSQANTPANARVLYAIRHRTDGDQSWMCGNAGDVLMNMTVSPAYWTFAGSRQITDTAQYNAESVAAGEGDFLALCMHMTVAPGTGTDAVTYTFQEDGADTSLAVALGASEVDECDTASDGDVTVEAGHAFNLKSATTDTPADTYGTWSVAWRSATRNRYMIPQSVRGNAVVSATRYLPVWGADNGYGATESDFNEQSQVKTRILAMYSEINTLGTCTLWTVTLRQNGADTAFSTQFSSVTALNDTDDLSIADNDLLTISVIGSICSAGGGPTVHTTFLAEGARRRVD